MGLAILGFLTGMVAFAAAPEKPATKASGAPVEIVLRSDGQTWVSVANVFVPEKFETKRISLAPGTYIVMGRRKGFRDVESPLVVRSGEPPRSLTIICTVSAQ